MNITPDRTPAAATEKEITPAPMEEQPWYHNSLALLQEKSNPVTEGALFLRAVVPVMNEKDHIANWAERRLKHILNNLDYSRIIAEVDETESQTPVMELWEDLTNLYGGIYTLRRHIDSVRTGGKLSIHTALDLKQVIVGIGRLEQKTSPYVLPEQEKPESVTLDFVRDVFRSISEADELTSKERSFRRYVESREEIPYSPNSLSYLRRSGVVYLMLTTNPRLTEAIVHRLDEQASFLQSKAINSVDLLHDEERPQKEAFLLEHLPYVFYLLPQNDDEQIATQVFAHANVIANISKQSDYYVNKLYRSISSILERIDIQNVLQEVATAHPELTEDAALEMLEDATFALRIFTRYSELPSQMLKTAITNFVDLAREKKVLPKDAWIFVLGMVKETQKLVGFSERDLNDKTIPTMDISKIQNAEHSHLYSYINVEFLKERLAILQEVLGAPLNLLIERIDFAPAYYEENVQELVIEKCEPNESKEAESFYMQRYINNIMHELGEAIIKELPLEYIQRYAEIFKQAQASNYSFVTGYSMREWNNGNFVLAVKEDLGEAIATFCSSYESNAALYQTSKERYLYVLELISHYIIKEQKINFQKLLLDFVENKESVPLPEVVPWNRIKNVRTYVGGRYFSGVRRLGKVFVLPNTLSEPSSKGAVHVYAVGLAVE